MRTRRGQLVLSAVVAFVVLVVIAIVGVAAGWIGPSGVSKPAARAAQPPAAGAMSPAPSTSSPASSTRATTAAPTGAPATRVPRTDDATVFARAVATLAFSYDTRSESRDAWRAALMSWLGPDGRLDTAADAQGDVDRVVPPASAWAQMRDLHQSASFTATAAYVPQQAVAAQRDYGNQWPPGTSVVTVRGNQQLSWDGGTQTTVRTMTIFVICQPTHPYCMVDRIPPQVIP